MDKFLMVLGDTNAVLPGKTWSQYEVEIGDSKMICTAKKEPNVVVEINYSDFKKAEFGIGNGNLWLQCELAQGELTFCSPRKYWKSDLGKKLIEKINSVTEIVDMKSYKQYTGPFFFIAMFK